MNETIKFTSRPCMQCGKTSTLTLDKKAFEAWQKTVHVQKAFPNMTAAEREILISGTHDECWKKMFG